MGTLLMGSAIDLSLHMLSGGQSGNLCWLSERKVPPQWEILGILQPLGSHMACMPTATCYWRG